MKSLLLTRIAPAAFLSAALAAGMAVPALAQSGGTAGQATGNAAAGTMNNNAPAANTANGGANGAAEAGPANGEQPMTLQQMADQRIKALHSRLNITQKEEAKWNKFANVMRNNARSLDKAYQARADKIDSMNAVENMRSYAHIERMRANDMQKLVSPFQSLYASLSPQQKQEANDLFRQRAQAAEQRHQAAAAAQSQSGH
jgi:protein CpxP